MTVVMVNDTHSAENLISTRHSLNNLFRLRTSSGCPSAPKGQRSIKRNKLFRAFYDCTQIYSTAGKLTLEVNCCCIKERVPNSAKLNASALDCINVSPFYFTRQALHTSRTLRSLGEFVHFPQNHASSAIKSESSTMSFFFFVFALSVYNT